MVPTANVRWLRFDPIGQLNWKCLGMHLSHQRHQSATTGYLQLAEDGMKMFFDRFETQAAFVGNLLIAAPIAHQTRQILFSNCEPNQVRQGSLISRSAAPT